MRPRLLPARALWRIVVPALLCLLLADQLSAFQGRVVYQESGQPAAGAEISILGRPGVARADADGRFTWTPDPPTPFEVLVILPGGRYMRPVLVQRLPAEGPVTIEVAPLVSETVSVTAGAAPWIETAPGSGTTLLSSTDLDVRQPVNLAQLLENVAGASTVSEGHAAVPAIRGLARGRTLILIDGARVTSERRVGPSATFLDPFVLEGVEIARGPGSVAYGSDALGGVIHARTRRVDPTAPLGFRFQGTLGTGVPEVRGGVEVSKGLGKGGVLFQAHARRFDDYRSPVGEVHNSGARDQGFLARFEYALGRGVLTTGWQSDFGRDIERPRNNSRVTRFVYPVEDSHRLTASYDLYRVARFSRMTFSGFLGNASLVTDQDRVATVSTPRSVERADLSSNDFQVRGTAEKLAGDTKIEIGVDVNGRRGLEALDITRAYDMQGTFVSETSNVSIEDAHRTDLGVYATAEAALVPQLTVAGGARADRVTMENEGGYFGRRSEARTGASGFVSLTAGSFRGISLTGQVARGFRDPTLSDRFYRGPTGRGYITGNPDLEPETSLQFDLALRYAAHRYRWAVYAYHYRLTDLVERYETTKDFFFFRNRGRARLRGLELEGQAELGLGFTTQVSAQLTRGAAPDEDIPLDDVPSESLALQLRKQLGARAFAQVRAAVHARDDRPGPTEVAMPGYTMLDASAGYKVTDNLELRFVGRNLLDQRYYASPDPRWVWAPGASGRINVVVTY
ncbi:MAG TPA: TonB-dependent receptor [Vicinamibacterales bacterium]|nr:TonB-dependent receptor [Vicinamibacterales bacterium]